MAFIDNPHIDNASKNSEESVLAVKSLFSQKNGFICRTETPDFGVDEDVELIINNQASGKKFAIQIKSVEKALIKEKDRLYISLQFKSSRLGYLCRRPPAYGIVIIYDDSTSKIYYEYAEVIYQQLNKQKGDDSWKSMEKPSILIPTENVLTNEEVNKIHKTITARHINAQQLLKSHGEEYQIPIFEDNITGNKIDYNNPKEISNHLSKYGLILIEELDLGLLYSQLSELPISEIYSNKDLTLLIAVVNCEIGKYIDAEFYLKKADSYEYNGTSAISKSFTQLKVDFALGKFGNDEFVLCLEDLLKETHSGYNRLMIKVNIINFKLISLLSDLVIDPNLKKEIDLVFEEILKTEMPEDKKYNLINYHAFNMNTYAMHVFSKSAGSLKIKESMNIHMSFSERLSEAQKLTEILNIPKKYTFQALDYAKETDNKVIRATSLYQLSFYFFMLQFDIFNLELNTNVARDGKEMFEKYFNLALESYNIFLSMSRLKEAYNSIQIAYEIRILFKQLFKSELGSKSASLIEQNLRGLEVEIGAKKYNSIVLEVISKKTDQKPDFYNEFQYKSDKELEESAERLIQAMGLPSERKVNILKEMLDTKYFQKNIVSSSIELLTDLRHTFSNQTYYSTIPTYVGKCKKCGFETIPNQDIKEIVDFLKYHKC